MSSKLEKNAAWEGGMLAVLQRQFFARPKPLQSDLRLSNQTAIITGANGGLGFEAARQLLQLGLSHLILGVRSQSKGEAAAQKLEKEFPDTKIDVFLLDMADYDSIITFTSRCRELSRIDYVILNAGFQAKSFERNAKTGHESVFQTNYLSTVLLSLLLTSLMREQKRNNTPVLTIVGSDTMYFSKLNPPGSIFQYMDDPSRFSKFQQYMDSKLLLMMFISRLAEKIPADEVVISVCNPGATAGTGLGQEEIAGFIKRHITPLFVKAIGRSVQVGASNYIHALVGEGRESHGSFVSDWSIKPYPVTMYTKKGLDLTGKLWQETLGELKSIPALSVDKLFAFRD